MRPRSVFAKLGASRKLTRRAALVTTKGRQIGIFYKTNLSRYGNRFYTIDYSGSRYCCFEQVNYCCGVVFLLKKKTRTEKLKCKNCIIKWRWAVACPLPIFCISLVLFKAFPSAYPLKNNILNSFSLSFYSLA